MEKYEIFDNLRKKDVCYTKADNGNTEVIINEGPYAEARGPLTLMEKEMKTALEICLDFSGKSESK